LLTYLYFQEVNLANNQLTALPALWLSLWGSPDASGLLQPEKDADSTAVAAKAKVLVLGNPLAMV
jgi:hypothetical protein